MKYIKILYAVLKAIECVNYYVYSVQFIFSNRSCVNSFSMMPCKLRDNIYGSFEFLISFLLMLVSIVVENCLISCVRIAPPRCCALPATCNLA